MRATLPTLAWAIALAASFGAEPARAAEPAVAVPGTRIVMAPPPGFVRSDRPAGFTSRAAGGVILVDELPPEAFDRVRRTATNPEEVRQAGATLVEVSELPGLPYEHALARATRQQGRAMVDVWTLVFRHPDVAGTVSASVTRTQPPAASAEAIRAALASVRVGANPVAGQAAGLPFEVDPPKRFAYRAALGDRQLLLKETPPAKDNAIGDVTVNIALAERDAVRPPDRAAIARQRVFALNSILVESAEPAVPVTYGGLPGMEILARGTTIAGHQRRIYHVTLFGPQAIYAIVATAHPTRFEAALGDLRALARSFKAK